MQFSGFGMGVNYAFAPACLAAGKRAHRAFCDGS